MNANHTCLSIRLAGVAVAVASLSSPLVAGAQGNGTAQQLYRDALAACNSGQSTQSRADCMNEARSVLRDARQGRAWTRDGGLGDSGSDGAQMDRDGQTGMQSEPRSSTRSSRNDGQGQQQRRTPSTGNTQDMQQNSGTQAVPR